VVQACEACSQSHLRCEDEKPCSRCRKKNIHCRVPEQPDDSVELDAVAVHAAQDLLDLSNGFDFPTPLQSRETSQLALTPKTDTHSSTVQYGRSSATMSASGDGPVDNSVAPRGRAHTHTLTTDPSPATGQRYIDSSGNGMAFFDNQIQPHFDETPGIDPFLPDYFNNMPQMDAFFSGQATPRGLMDLSFDLDIGLTDVDLGLLDQYNFQVPFAADTPSTDAQDTQVPEQHWPESDSVPVRTEAFKQSVWRYLPQPNKDFGGSEQGNLAFADPEKGTNRRPHFIQRRVVTESLTRVSRDRLMALVLGTCSRENVGRISSAFPGIELLDTLIQVFLTSPSLDAQWWFHLPTLSPSKLSPELLGCVVSAGAASTPDTPLRKLGFALQEASRIGQARAFEADNSAIRELQNLRALLLELQVGMWSGIRWVLCYIAHASQTLTPHSRKMEISESFLQPLVTMLRRGGRFRRSTWKEISPTTDEQGTSLEEKWQRWVHQESFLRLTYRTFELDRQSSMALLKPPLISYAEMQLPLPSPSPLWHAPTATAWKAAYIHNARMTLERPSALEIFLDLGQLARYDSASTIYLHMVWGMCWELRQISALTVRAPPQANNSLVLSSRHSELTKQLEDFHVHSPPLNKSNEMILELMLVHLNAPLDGKSKKLSINREPH